MPGGYDARGNLTSDGQRTFAYDVENRLISSSGGGAAMSFSYDPLGRLFEVVSAGATTQFLYDGDRLVAEFDGAATSPLRRYVHGAGVDEPVVWYEGPGTGGRRWLHSDRQGSITAWTDSLAAISVYTYGPYGEPHDWQGSRFRYTGQAVLPEAQLYHYKARVYDPVRGRFLQTDPVGYEDGLNLYAYVANDPTNKTDPTGKWLWPWEKPITVVGENPAARQAVQQAVDRGAQTPRGKELVKQIEGGWRRGRPIEVRATDSGKARAETPGKRVEVNPKFHPKINTTEGVQPASTVRVVWHEIGHAVTGTVDSGAGRMDNIRQNENPVATALGEPARTTYETPRQ